MGGWGEKEMGREGDGEMGRWGDGEMGRTFKPFSYSKLRLVKSFPNLLLITYYLLLIASSTITK
ncbi:MAG: hypothetical protein F6K16_01460 [Symploca sp. SIO2B6]|nr:hypothetical protein [Symploca sp. SIO2B6]